MNAFYNKSGENYSNLGLQNTRRPEWAQLRNKGFLFSFYFYELDFDL